MKQHWGSGLEITTVGITLVITTVAGYFGGNWLDGRLSTEPVFTVVGVLFGAVAGFVQLFRVAGVPGRSDRDRDGK